MEVTKEENFPIERARLRTVPVMLVVYAACVIGYGWCLQRRVSLAGPLVLQFFSELNLHAVCTHFLTTNQTSWVHRHRRYEYHSNTHNRPPPCPEFFRNSLRS